MVEGRPTQRESPTPPASTYLLLGNQPILGETSSHNPQILDRTLISLSYSCVIVIVTSIFVYPQSTACSSEFKIAFEKKLF